MSSGKLYEKADHFRALQILAAAKEGGWTIEMAGDSLPNWNKMEFPFTKTPILDTGSQKVHGSGAISMLVGGPQLRGGCNAAFKGSQDNTAQVLQWVLWTESQLNPLAMGWLLPSLSVAPFDKKSVESCKEEVLQVLGMLDMFLLKQTFLVWERLSNADLAVAFALLPLYQHLLDTDTRSRFPNVFRWFQTVMNRPAFKEILDGQLNWCQTPVAFDGKKFKELQGGADAGPKPDKEAGKAAKKERAQKQQTPKKEPEPEPEEEMDATEQAMAAEPKAKDPFAQYEKGTFVMDDFKRVYSNEDTIEKAIPYFWEKFDPANYSIWYCEYKFPEELTMVFMSCNLIGGMFQRLDKMRKNAFGSVCLFGSNNNSTISGIWFWRGHDLAFTLSPDWQIDYESYTWTKLNFDDPKTKKLINEYLAWEGDFDGKQFNQGKIFK